MVTSEMNMNRNELEWERTCMGLQKKWLHSNSLMFTGIVFYTLDIVLWWVLREADSEMKLARRSCVGVSFGIYTWEREGKEAGVGRGRRPSAMQACHPQPHPWCFPKLNCQELSHGNHSWQALIFGLSSHQTWATPGRHTPCSWGFPHGTASWSLCTNSISSSWDSSPFLKGQTGRCI